MKNHYTLSSDYIRGLAGYSNGQTILSRSEASTIREGIAKVIGMNDQDLSEKLAWYYSCNEKELTEQSVKAFMQSLNQKSGE